MMVSGETCQRPKGPEPAPPTSGTGNDSSRKVAISRSEDRDKSGKPVVLRDHCHSWSSRLSTAAAYGAASQNLDFGRLSGTSSWSGFHLSEVGASIRA